MSTLFARSTAVIALVATSSLAGKEGYAYKLDASNQAILCASVSDVPHGIIGAVSEDGLEISALPLGGNHGPVLVKLGAAVTDLRKDLTLRADSTFESDDAAGPRVICARPLETGAADELIEAVLIAPRVFGAAVAALATADGSDAGTTQTLANATKAKLNAVIAALQTAGYLA